MTSPGLHHVTAIAGPARRNLDFYTRVLGQRLVKKTVNFDDPGTYHLYYGDGEAAPGSIITFFPWEHAAAGRFGAGETQETAYRVPQGAIGFWLQRLAAANIPHELPVKRFGETAVTFRDPDGMRLALVGVAGAEAEPAFAAADIPQEHALRGFHSVTLVLDDVAPTGAVLSDVFGFAEAGREGETVRHATPAGGVGGIVDLRRAASPLPLRLGAGSVHHVAFRAADDDAQAAMVRRLAENHRLQTTGQRDRNYFRSVYFREPGRVLFEIATDVPGFAVDEPAAELGRSLKLPAVLEPRRAELEGVLPRLD
jgi:glyoxalase family protein